MRFEDVLIDRKVRMNLAVRIVGVLLGLGIAAISYSIYQLIAG